MNTAMSVVGYGVAIPFVVYFYISVYILMNLFVSILLSATDKEDELTADQFWSSNAPRMT